MVEWASAVLHVLLPRACVHCREDLPARAEGPLCAACAAGMPPPPDPGCVRCAAALFSRRDFCGACSGRLFACRLIRAAAAHRGPAASLVHAFKFRGFRSAAREAGRLLAEDAGRRPELAGFDAVVPVPLHPRRRRERGWNQAELLAREVAARSGRPIIDALVRVRGARPSWSLGRAARRAELSGAFAVRDELRPVLVGRRVLLVDDVCASGTTLEECALALRRAGARDAAAVVFSRAGSFT